MSKEKTASAVIKKIKEAKITPEPKWQLRTKDGAVWLLFFLLVFWGGLIFSVLLSSALEIEKDLLSNHYPIWESGLLLFWLTLALSLLIIALFIFKHLGQGYRYQSALILSLLFLVAGLLAAGFLLTRPGRKLEKTLNCPCHKIQEVTKKKQWSNPNAGLLSGEIQVVEPEALIINDFKNQKWRVPCCHNVRIKGGLKLKEKLIIKIIGEEEGKAEEEVESSEESKAHPVFKAQEIRPWSKADIF